MRTWAIVAAILVAGAMIAGAIVFVATRGPDPVWHNDPADPSIRWVTGVDASWCAKHGGVWRPESRPDPTCYIAVPAR